MTSTIVKWLKRSFLLEVVEMIQERYWYYKAEKKGSFSQHGEDLFVLNYFKNTRSGTYIDVGANHPFKISNTFLLYSKGWRGVTIEPIPHLHHKHEQWRPQDICLNCGVASVKEKLEFYELIPRVLSSFDKEVVDELIRKGRAVLRHKYNIDVISLMEVVQEHLNGNEIDLLSIDTEGLDYEILQSIDWSLVRPRMIICELDKYSGQDISNEMGVFLAKIGYRKIQSMGCNGVYIDELSEKPGPDVGDRS